MDRTEKSIMGLALAGVVGVFLLYAAGISFVIWVIVKFMQHFGIV